MLKSAIKIANIAAFAGSIILSTAAVATSANAAPNGGFWSCWAARDFQGNGSTFTGGCWDRYMSIKMPASTENRLKEIAKAYGAEQSATKDARQQSALRAKYQARFAAMDLTAK